MASQFRAECIRKSKKEVAWFDTKDEAIDWLKLLAAFEAIDTIPTNGGGRAKAFMEAVPKYLDKMETIEDNISEWFPPHKK